MGGTSLSLLFIGLLALLLKVEALTWTRMLNMNTVGAKENMNNLYNWMNCCSAQKKRK